MSRSTSSPSVETAFHADTFPDTAEPPTAQGRILVGHDALSTVRAQAFDLILTDLRLGSDDGLEMLAELRKLAPDTVAIVLTGYASLESAIEAMRQGAYDYLVKPTDV